MSDLSVMIEGLRLYNRWRRGDEELPQPEPAEIGRLIDGVCDSVEGVLKEVEFYHECCEQYRDDQYRLLEAARAVIERWEQPSWKDVEPTAAVIYRLRNVIQEITGEGLE